MDDNHETFPSLPSNYITIVDLQKRWLEQQQQQKNKQLKEEFKSDKPEIHNKNTHVSNPNSHFQKKAVQLNPNFKPTKPFGNNFSDKQPSQSNAADFVVVDSVKEVENSKVDGENKRKKKRNKKYCKMGKEDDDQEKGKVIDDDQTVEIEPNFKKDMPTAAIEAPKRVYGGNRKFNSRELQVKETHKVCVEERKNVGEKKGKSRGVVRKEIQLHGRESKVENKVSAEKENVGEVKGKTRGAVREETQLHGRESKLENKVSAERENVGEEKMKPRGAVREETDNKGEVIVENQTAEIESELTRVSVSGKYWRPRAAIKGSKVGYNDYRRGRGFYMKNRQYEQKSFRPVRDGSKLHGGIDRAENKELKGEQNSELEARDLHGDVGGLENVVCVEKAGNQCDLNARNDDPNESNGRAKIEQNSGLEAPEVGGLEAVCFEGG